MLCLLSERRTRGTHGRRTDVPCPAMIRDYHKWMGGVDVHDQLRLQRYSLQLQTWCKKYYKSIFLGLVDVAIVNAYIIFREAHKRNGGSPMSHAEFLVELHAQLLALTKYDFDESVSPDVVSVSCWIMLTYCMTHMLYVDSQDHKRPQLATSFHPCHLATNLGNVLSTRS